MTRLDEAIRELAAAAGARPWVLVMERAHEDAPTVRPTVHEPDGQPFYVSIGLMEQAKFAQLRDSGLLTCVHVAEDSDA